MIIALLEMFEDHGISSLCKEILEIFKSYSHLLGRS